MLTIDRARLSARYALNPGCDAQAIAAMQARLAFRLPPDYAALLRLSNGLSTQGCLMLLELDAIGPRNADYEVQIYLPDYVMIGDDSGGRALLMRADAPTVYEVGMGSLEEDELAVSARSLEQLLLEFGGRTLGER